MATVNGRGKTFESTMNFDPSRGRAYIPRNDRPDWFDTGTGVFVTVFDLDNEYKVRQGSERLHFDEAATEDLKALDDHKIDVRVIFAEDDVTPGEYGNRHPELADMADREDELQEWLWTGGPYDPDELSVDNGTALQWVLSEYHDCMYLMATVGQHYTEIKMCRAALESFEDEDHA